MRSPARHFCSRPAEPPPAQSNSASQRSGGCKSTPDRIAELQAYQDVTATYPELGSLWYVSKTPITGHRLHPRHAPAYPYPLEIRKSTSGRLEIHVNGTVNASSAARDRFLDALEALGLPGLNTDEVRAGSARPGRASPSMPDAATRSAGPLLEAALHLIHE